MGGQAPSRPLDQDDNRGRTRLEARIMTRYQVRFELENSWVVDYYETTIAATEHEAIDKIKKKYPTSFGHWVNRLANEVV